MSRKDSLRSWDPLDEYEEFSDEYEAFFASMEVAPLAGWERALLNSAGNHPSSPEGQKDA